MRLEKIICFTSILLMFNFSCNEENSKIESLQKIEKFSGLKIEKVYVDSISYNYNFSIGDDVSIYLIYIEKKYFDSLMIQNIKELTKFKKENDSIISYSEMRVGIIEQVDVNLNRQMVVYSISNL